MLINVSRGGLVQTEALHDALEDGQLGALGMDVYESEQQQCGRRGPCVTQGGLFWDDKEPEGNGCLRGGQGWRRRRSTACAALGREGQVSRRIALSVPGLTASSVCVRPRYVPPLDHPRHDIRRRG